MPLLNRPAVVFLFVRQLAAVIGVACGILLCVAPLASARDLGQWGNTDLATRQWFKGLTMPDHPTISCCENADGYWADRFEVDGNQYVAIITDTRSDIPLGRPHIPPGTRVVIPNHRIVRDAKNPTGHGWVFIFLDSVRCYLPPTGV